MKKISAVALVVFSFALVFTAGFFGLLYPRFQEFGRLDTTLAAYTDSVTPSKAGDSKQLAVKKAELANSAEKVNRLLPNESSLYDLSIQLEALVKAEGVTLSNVTLTPSASDSGQAVTTSEQATGADVSIKAPKSTEKALISMTMSGTYGQLQSFIDGMTSLDRYIEITELTFTKAAVTDTVLALQITANTYYMSKAK